MSELVDCQFAGTLAVGEIFQSHLVYALGYDTITFSVNVSKASTFKIFKTRGEDPTTLRPETGTLFYQEKLSAGEFFQKRLFLACRYFYVELINDDTSNPCVGEVSVYTSKEVYNAQGFLNSPINLRNQASLVLNGNDFNLDLIRNLHTEFKKINIGGAITDYTNVLSTGQGTVGPSANKFILSNTAVDLYITNVATDTTAGTGAQFITIIYNDANNDRIETQLQLSASGTNIVPGVQVSCVERMFVSGTGSDNKNFGAIVAQNSSGSVIFNEIPAGENISRTAIFRVPDERELAVSNVIISGYTAVPGVINIIEGGANQGTSGIQVRKSLGHFRLGTVPFQYTYELNGLISANNFFLLEFNPDSPTIPTNPIDIQVMVNGMLCPLPNAF
jgi:hypothetical protein